MSRIIVFDVNETLLDVSAIEPDFSRVFGEVGALRQWFSLLLLHSEVATLSGPYFDFATLAGAALEMTAASRQIALSLDDKRRILERILSLPPHPEVPTALEMLRDAGLRLVTLTNSSQRAVDQQLANAGISKFFERNFSVDSIRRYKPAPEVYRMVATELHVEPARLRLVAAHAWDVLGAMQVGCAAAFVARPGQALFPLTPAPDIVAPNLKAVATEILRREISKSGRGDEG